MKIGIEDVPFIRRYGFEKGMEKIRSLGYDCIDYQRLANTNLPMFQCPDSEFDKFMESDRKFIESTGLEISQTHGPWRWPTQDATPEDRAERFEKMSRAIRGTALLGCRYFVIHPIMPWGGGLDPEPQKMYDMNLEFMTRLCEVGVKNDVVVCFENMPMPDLSLASPEACLKLAKEINSSHFKVCLDTGHCTMLKVNPADAVRMLGKDMLRVLHVHDNAGERDHDCHWVPFWGIIDWTDFRKALQEIGFEGTVSLETGVPQHFEGEIRELQDRSLVLSAKWIAGLTD